MPAALFVSLLAAVSQVIAGEEGAAPAGKYTMTQAVHDYGGLPMCHKICLATRVETAEGLISRYTPLEFCRAGDAMARDIGNAAGVWLDRGAARCIVADCEEHHPDAARQASEWRSALCRAAEAAAAAQGPKPN